MGLWFLWETGNTRVSRTQDFAPSASPSGPSHSAPALNPKSTTQSHPRELAATPVLSTRTGAHEGPVSLWSAGPGFSRRKAKVS